MHLLPRTLGFVLGFCSTTFHWALVLAMHLGATIPAPGIFVCDALPGMQPFALLARTAAVVTFEPPAWHLGCTTTAFSS